MYPVVVLPVDVDSGYMSTEQLVWNMMVMRLQQRRHGVSAAGHVEPKGLRRRQVMAAIWSSVWNKGYPLKLEDTLSQRVSSIGHFLYKVLLTML